MKTTDSLAELVREARTALGLSQEKLARALKISYPTVNRWENGRTRPDERSLHGLSELLKKRGLTEIAHRLPDLAGNAGAAATSPKRRGRTSQPTLPSPTNGSLDTKTMEGMLWKAACSIRGEKDAPKFKDYILPLMFLKRLSDVFEDEIARLVEDYGDEATAREVLEADRSLVRFYIPEEATWPVISGRRSYSWSGTKAPRTKAEHVTTALRTVAKANPSLQGVIDIVDFNASSHGEREISDEALERIIELFSEPRYRLGLKDVEPDFLGRAYEYLLRKFAEGQGQSAGEFFTPKEVGWLIAHLVNPKQGEDVYDFACGSAGLLVKCQLLLRERDKEVRRPLKLFGQEFTGSSFAIARMNMVLHDTDAEIVRGDTMANPKFTDGAGLRRFDIVVANPMWNQNNFEVSLYENDPYGRFESGYAPASTADWAWLQHAVASLNEHGRAAIVLDTGAVSRGSGNQGENKEKAIRKAFVESDWVEAVILLPENLFYNTPASGVIVVLNRAKKKERRGKILLINARGEFEKGRPKNFLADAGIKRITEAFQSGQDVPQLQRVVTITEVASNDFNLSPSKYVRVESAAAVRDIQMTLNELAEVNSRASALDTEIAELFRSWSYKIGNQGPN